MREHWTAAELRALADRLRQMTDDDEAVQALTAFAELMFCEEDAD